jgi:hypothetical protein
VGLDIGLGLPWMIAFICFMSNLRRLAFGAIGGGETEIPFPVLGGKTDVTLRPGSSIRLFCGSTSYQLISDQELQALGKLGDRINIRRNEQRDPCAL